MYGLALGGGGARGFAHIGVLEYIHEHNITISEIAGTSIGAVIGAMYAAGMTIQNIRKAMLDVGYLDLLDVNLQTGLIDGKKIYAWLVLLFGDKKMEDLQIPLSILATDIDTSKKVVFNSGSIVDAVRASIAIPGLIAPYLYDKKLLVDGGLVENLPLSVLKSNKSIAVSLSEGPQDNFEYRSDWFGVSLPKNIFSVYKQLILRSMDIMLLAQENHTVSAYPGCILIRPVLGGHGILDLSNRELLIEKGYIATKKILKFEGSLIS